MKRIWMVGATAALLASAAVEVPRAQMCVVATGAGKHEILSGAKTVTFPFTVASNWVLVPVRVNGSDPFHLILDTGMPLHGAILFDGPRARALGFGAAPDGKGCGTAAASAEASSVVLDLPGLRLTDETVTVLPAPGKPADKLPPADGIIGASLFGPFAVHIDHDAMTITLTEADAFSPPAALTAIPLTVSPGSMVEIQCSIEQADGSVAPAALVVDTGAPHAVSLNVEPGSLLVLPEKTIEASLGQTYAGERLGRVGRIRSLRIGDAVLRDVVASFPSSPRDGVGCVEKDGNLGSGVLRRFNVTFDFAHDRVFLEPNSRFADPFEYQMSGIQFQTTDAGALGISRIVPGSPAEEAGIAAGDVVVSVDGVPTPDLGPDVLSEAFRGEGRTVVLRVARAGAERDVTLTLRRLI